MGATTLACLLAAAINPWGFEIYGYVGDLATKNLDDLGHIVLYVNQPDQKLLPGAVLATGDVPDLKAGDVIEFRSSS